MSGGDRAYLRRDSILFICVLSISDIAILSVVLATERRG
jgi:hypothetical protein